MTTNKAKLTLATFELDGWMEAVINAIEAHPEKRDSEQYQGLAEYTVNKSLGVTIRFPRNSGHTLLANYIAAKYPTLLIYGNMDHYRKVTGNFPLHPGTETVSMYEVHYAAYKQSNIQPTPEFQELKKKFAEKKVVVVDNAGSVPQDLHDLIYHNSVGIVILLGH